MGTASPTVGQNTRNRDRRRLSDAEYDAAHPRGKSRPVSTDHLCPQGLHDITVLANTTRHGRCLPCKQAAQIFRRRGLCGRGLHDMTNPENVVGTVKHRRCRGCSNADQFRRAAARTPEQVAAERKKQREYRRAERQAKRGGLCRRGLHDMTNPANRQGYTTGAGNPGVRCHPCRLDDQRRNKSARLGEDIFTYLKTVFVPEVSRPADGWQDRGLCVNQDTEMWALDPFNDRIDTAKAICAQCPVRQACHLAAKATGDLSYYRGYQFLPANCGTCGAVKAEPSDPHCDACTDVVRARVSATYKGA